MAETTNGLTVLWATDGSHHRESAFGLFREMVLPVAGRIVALTVAPHAMLGGSRPDANFLTRATRTAKAHALTEAHLACERDVVALDPSVPVEIMTRWGHPIEEVLRVANSVRADLIVMAAKGHTNLHLILLGSVSQGVAHLSTRPLLIVRPGSKDLSSVLVGYHGSTNAKKALRFLGRLALPAGARIHLVNVIEPMSLPAGTPAAFRRQAEATAQGLDEARRKAAVESLESATRELTAHGHNAGYEVVAGDAGVQLDQAARRLGADLVVVGSRRAAPADHYLLGATTEKILRHSNTSVLVVR